MQLCNFKPSLKDFLVPEGKVALVNLFFSVTSIVGLTISQLCFTYIQITEVLVFSEWNNKKTLKKQVLSGLNTENWVLHLNVKTSTLFSGPNVCSGWICG